LHGDRKRQKIRLSPYKESKVHIHEQTEIIVDTAIMAYRTFIVKPGRPKRNSRKIHYQKQRRKTTTSFVQIG
jgi:hypothetical protein